MSQSLENQLSILILATDDVDPTPTVESVRPLGVKIYIVGKEIEGCSKIDFPWPHNYAEARNTAQSYLSTPWVFHIDSDEILNPLSLPSFSKLLADEKIIKVSIQQERVQVLQPRLLPTRCQWERRSHEIPIGDFGIMKAPEIIIDHKVLDAKLRIKKSLYNFELINKEWTEKGDPDALFLCAITGTFISPEKAEFYARTFLHNFANLLTPKGKEQNLLMGYTLAYIEGIIKKEFPKAIRRLRMLIAMEPKLCELWCLLGDLYLLLNSPIQAKEIFENALIIGREFNPLKTNRIWVDLDKYSEYPMVRIQHCDQIGI